MFNQCAENVGGLVENGNMISNPTFLSWSIALFVAVSPVSSFSEDAAGRKDASKTEGFRFRGGNPEDGQKAFTTLNCMGCHSVRSVNVQRPSEKGWIDLELASELRFVKSYEDIILAITNPRHVMNEQYRAILTDAELQGGIDPLMPDLTDDMSAKQLMDLTAFLHQVYTRELPGYGIKENK